jgi:hypothetical protein
MKNLKRKYNVESIREIILTNDTDDVKINKIGTYLTDMEEGISLGNTNLGSIIDEWFDELISAEDGINQITDLIFNPDKIIDLSDELI